jgi:hypothetical protein
MCLCNTPSLQGAFRENGRVSACYEKVNPAAVFAQTFLIVWAGKVMTRRA